MWREDSEFVQTHMAIALNKSENRLAEIVWKGKEISRKDLPNNIEPLEVCFFAITATIFGYSITSPHIC